MSFVMSSMGPLLLKHLRSDQNSAFVSSTKGPQDSLSRRTRSQKSLTNRHNLLNNLPEIRQNTVRPLGYARAQEGRIMSRKSREIARENGAKAAGSKAQEGIQKSAMNAVRHGLTGKTLVLCNESQAQFDALTERYIQKFQPQDDVDMELIEDLVAARWRLQRVRLMQAAALDLEMDRQADEVEASFVNIDEPTRVTLAFTKLANTEKSLELFHRYETTYARQ